VASGGNYVVTVAGISGGSGGTMTVINATTNKVVNTFTVPVGNSLNNVVLSSDGRTAYVFSHNGMMGVVNTETGAVTKTLAVGAYLHDATSVDIRGDKIFIASDDSPTGKSLSVVNITTGAVTEVSLPGSSTGVAVSSDGKTVYVATSSDQLQSDAAIAIIDATTGTVITTIRGDAPVSSEFGRDVAASADGKYIYSITDTTWPSSSGLLSVIDADTHAIVDQIALEGAPSEVAMSPNGRYIYLAVTPSADAPATLYAISTAPGGDYTGIQADIKGLSDVLNFIGIYDDLTHKLSDLTGVWNLDGLFRFNSLARGVTDLLEGVRRGDNSLIASGIADIVVAVLPKPYATVLDIGKYLISIVLPLNAEDQAAFIDFRAKCMFHKSSDQLSPSEAQQLVDHYSGLGAIALIPAEYARYNVGGWIGSPQC
jgi:hypothetical protein